jgi:hypothetical protein
MMKFGGGGVSMSLRRRLSALVAIALVASLLLSAYHAARWKIFLEDEANTTALAAARFISAEFGLVIDNSRQLPPSFTPKKAGSISVQGLLLRRQPFYFVSSGLFRVHFAHTKNAAAMKPSGSPSLMN